MWDRIKKALKPGNGTDASGGGGIFDRKYLPFKVMLLFLALGLGAIFNNAYQANAEYLLELDRTESGRVDDRLNLESVPMLGKGVGAVMAAIAFLVCMALSDRRSQKAQKWLIIIPLWIASIGALIAWLPTDWYAMQSALDGKATAGENPSIRAYMGKLVLIGFLILSPPIITGLFFRLEILDQYVVRAFLGPFVFSLIAFISIFMIFDFTDNGPAFTGQLALMGQFYAVQIPFMVCFLMPIVIPLSLLFSLTNLSKSNEFISMIGTGRSVFRILAPLIFIGGYLSLISLALKYDWAPEAEGQSTALIEKAKDIRKAKKLTQAEKRQKVLWVKTGWMHVNDFADRTWFVGQVPLKLSDPMVNVMIWKRDENGQPLTIWQAKRARWVWNSKPSKWVLLNGKVFEYGEDRVPRITRFDKLELKGWNETPWKVISSAQEPDFLGLPGLTMFLNANKEMSARDLAPFRVNWWIIFAEPFNCFVMVLVAAPFGIIYGRKGAAGGFVVAASILAVSYMFGITFKSLGHGYMIPPFFAAWSCNIVLAILGLVLLWFKSHNRDLPKLKNLFSSSS